MCIKALVNCLSLCCHSVLSLIQVLFSIVSFMVMCDSESKTLKENKN